jgi:hypothetical protein
MTGAAMSAAISIKFNPSRIYVLQRKFPIDQLVEDGINVVGTSILIIEVISVLPHVNDQQGLQAHRHRHIGIGSLYHLELGSIDDKPGPTTPELGNGCTGEFFFAGVDTAKGCLDLPFKGVGRLAASI